jgi:2'-5' RNA ligase
MTAHIAFISLEPDAHLASLVSGYKQRVQKLIGDQLYLQDPPHTTLYLAAFDQLDRLGNALFHLAANIESIPVTLAGWHVFSNDSLTGNHTLVCQCRDDSRQLAQAVQAAVIAGLAPLRNAAATEARYTSRWNCLTTEQKRSVLEFGFPFTGAAWHPHLTIASIRPSDFEIAYRDLKQKPPYTTGVAFSLKLYELIDGVPQAVMRAPLRSQAKASPAKAA